MMFFPVFQVLIILLAPLFLMRLTKSLGWERWLSPVVLSYLVGILIGNLHLFPLNAQISTFFSAASVLLAIPLLLYPTDLLGWFKYAKSTLLSFALLVFSALICSMLVALFFKDQIEHGWVMAGMLVGMATGGTPNLNAIAIAENAPEDVIIYLNAADIIVGGIFLIFLTSVAHRIYGTFLPDFQHDIPGAGSEQDDKPIPPKLLFKKPSLLKDLSLSYALTVLIIGLAVGLTQVLTGELKSISLIILLLTLFSVIASLSPKIRRIRGTYESGEYLLLMFCIAIGMLADLRSLATDGTGTLIFTALFFSSTICLHLFLSWLFKIDRDTTMITSTAGLYGPPFIGQIASVIKNKTLIFSGMATGLVGYAIGNFLGIGIADILKRWFF